MHSSNPCPSNSTAKIKHCYGFIAGALSIAGKMVACIEMHHQSGREPNGRTHHIGVLDKAVATKEGAHSTVNCGDYSVLTVGKTIIDVNRVVWCKGCMAQAQGRGSNPRHPLQS